MVRKKQVKKQVKTFSTNGEIYDWLVEKMQTSRSNISMSELISNYLGYIYYEIKNTLDYFEQNKIKIDEAWTVKKIIEEVNIPPANLDTLMVDPQIKGRLEAIIHDQAMGILEQYQTEQKQIMENIKLRKSADYFFKKIK